MKRIKQIEDPYSDPEWIAARHRAGLSEFFEVSLALSEFGELAASRSSATGANPVPGGGVLLGDGGILDGGFDPTRDQIEMNVEI